MKKELTIKKILLENSEKIKIAIVQSSYHSELNENMTEYCKNTLIQNGILDENIAVYLAPGSWEIPLIAQKVANSNQYDAIVAFGVIIKGDTYHFEMIANEVSRALMDIAVRHEIPIGFEILAVNNLEQAKARASRNEFNKGTEAGNAVLAALGTLIDIK